VLYSPASATANADAVARAHATAFAIAAANASANVTWNFDDAMASICYIRIPIAGYAQARTAV
jgi:hypothetical protein